MLTLEKIRNFDHELVVFFQDKTVGLKGFIAIHNTKLGPATGGTRYMAYNSELEALEDALRLSKSMTYKCALAGVPYGGGKAVIMADPQNPKTKNYLESYAQKINTLGGKFYTGEDVGMDQKDMEVLAEASPYINGRPGVGGSPSPWAALSVFYSIKAALQEKYNSNSIEGKTFAIKGLGHLGIELCRLIYENGGIVSAADINTERTKIAQEKFPAITIVSTDEIHKIPVDVYAPCALGGEFNEKNINELQCKIICGGANNQLTTDIIGLELFKKGILYIPDYIANAGGLINVTDEWVQGGYNKERVHSKIKSVENTIGRVLAVAKKEQKPTHLVADNLAQGLFQQHN